MGPQDPKDVSSAIARHLSSLAGEPNALRADANHWLEGPEYTALRLRLESAHAAAEAALVEARRRVRLNEGQLRPSRFAAPLWFALE
jgi:hypothetical protein